VDDQKTSAVFGVEAEKHRQSRAAAAKRYKRKARSRQTCTSVYRFDNTFCKQQNVLLLGTTVVHGGSENLTGTVNG